MVDIWKVLNCVMITLMQNITTIPIVSLKICVGLTKNFEVYA